MDESIAIRKMKAEARDISRLQDLADSEGNDPFCLAQFVDQSAIKSPLLLDKIVITDEDLEDF